MTIANCAEVVPQGRFCRRLIPAALPSAMSRTTLAQVPLIYFAWKASAGHSAPWLLAPAADAVAGSVRGDEFFPERFAQQDFVQEFLFVLGRRGQVGIDGQAQGEGGALSLLARGVNAATVMVHDEEARH